MLGGCQRLSREENWILLSIFYRWWNWGSEGFNKLTEVAQLELSEARWKPKGTCFDFRAHLVYSNLTYHRGLDQITAGWKSRKEIYPWGPTGKWKISVFKKRDNFSIGNGIRFSSSQVSGTTALVSVGAKPRWWERKKPTGAGEVAKASISLGLRDTERRWFLEPKTRITCQRLEHCGPIRWHQITAGVICQGPVGDRKDWLACPFLASSNLSSVSFMHGSHQLTQTCGASPPSRGGKGNRSEGQQPRTSTEGPGIHRNKEMEDGELGVTEREQSRT